MTRFRMTPLILSLFLISCGKLAAQVHQGTSAQPEVLTRGPVHEAFAETVVYNPTPGVIVPAAPPRNIEEVPPDQMPDGDNMTWIPGYWAWDDSRDDFVWVSGIWRVVPPGRDWIPGYWTSATGGGNQWVPGYWANSVTTEVEYLPEPPESIEVGPNVPSPSSDSIWVSGTWVWRSRHYAWQPGYWVRTSPQYQWVPAHYVWAPGGYVFVDGYWDYDFDNRGILFAPVYFQPSVVYYQPRVVYAPTTIININFISDSLFVRPYYNHYYFGDYYAPSWERRGFYAAFSFQTRNYGYDPIYTHRRWQHRNDRDWDRREEERYNYRRDNWKNRPPQTYKDQVAYKTRNGKDLELAGGSLLRDYASAVKDRMKFRNLNDGDKKNYAQITQNVERARQERQKADKEAAVKRSVVPQTPVGQGAKPNVQKDEPTKARLPKTQIVSKPTNQKAAPPKPTPPPAVDNKVAPKVRTTPAQPVKINPATKRQIDREPKAAKPERPDKPDKPDKGDKGDKRDKDRKP